MGRPQCKDDVAKARTGREKGSRMVGARRDVSMGGEEQEDRRPVPHLDGFIYVGGGGRGRPRRCDPLQIKTATETVWHTTLCFP